MFQLITYYSSSIEAIGALEYKAFTAFAEIRRIMHMLTHEQCSFVFLMQSLSVEVQQGNAACVFDTVQPTARWDD